MDMRWRCLLLAALAAAPLSAAAQSFRAGSLTIEQPWARASTGASANSAAYMRVKNSGDAPDRLTAVRTDLADATMLHESRLEDGVMRMVHLPRGVEIPAHGSAELKPLGLHVMITGLKQPLKAGDSIPMTLVFEKQGEVAIQVSVGQPK